MGYADDTLFGASLTMQMSHPDSVLQFPGQEMRL